MAQKDYVSVNKQKAASPQPKAPVPWIRIAITVGLIAGFAYFLWSINGSAEKAPTPVTEQKKQQDSKSEIPTPKQEKWEYIKDLPQQQVKVDVPEVETNNILWQMQCGSFRQEAKAGEMRAKLAFQGLESQVRQSTGRNGLWYRVVLGPYEGKRSAETARQSARKAGIHTCEIWKWTN